MYYYYGKLAGRIVIRWFALSLISPFLYRVVMTDIANSKLKIST